ncbi:MAG: TIR domain-containing protein [Muribaculaceae bacterium]|nr:TIR domain-containing protein [Muribaculaceae bacterium]
MNYKYFAFISYSHSDMRFARWLQGKLEGYKLPTRPVRVNNEIKHGCRYLQPVFRDQTDMNSGVLDEELQKNLESSKYLVLLCSKSSAASTWVNGEVQSFIDMGRFANIIPVLIPSPGVPETELFPAALREYSRMHGKELRGINIAEGREKAFIQVVTRMLGLDFDELWQRYRRARRQRIAAITAFSVVAALCAYTFALPVKLDVNVLPEPSQLPVGEELHLTVDGAEYTVPVNEPHVAGISVPGYRRLGRIDVSLSSQFFTSVDTSVATGFGLRRQLALDLRRDDSFALYAGVVYTDDMEPLEGVAVSVADCTVATDSDGRFAITLPLAEQRAEQCITLTRSGYRTIVREDESPSGDLRFILHKD